MSYAENVAYKLQINYVLLNLRVISRCIFSYMISSIINFHFIFRAYENQLVPKSYRTPYLILFYSDWCFTCLQMEPVWRRIMEELEPIGVGIATIHSEHESLLARKVGVSSLPLMVLLMDGKAMHYKESLFSVQKVVGKLNCWL